MPRHVSVQTEVTKMRDLGKEIYEKTMKDGLLSIQVTVKENEKVGRLNIEKVEGIVEQEPIEWTRLTAPNGGINVLPILRTDGEEQYVLTYKPQVSVGSWTYELIGGYGKPGETSEDTAKRELREETGFEAGKLTIISPAICNFPGRLAWYDTTFSAEELTYLGKTTTEAEERPMKIIALKPVEVMSILQNHQVLSALSTATLYEYMMGRYFEPTEEYRKFLRR